jgi:hypothetical protein
MLILKVDVRSLDSSDAFELGRFLNPDEPGTEVRFHMFVQESAHAHDKLLEIIIKYGPTIGTAIFGAMAGALKEKIKSFLLKKRECDHRTIPIYGPNGEVVKVVECEIKHPAK